MLTLTQALLLQDTAGKAREDQWVKVLPATSAPPPWEPSRTNSAVPHSSLQQLGFLPGTIQYLPAQGPLSTSRLLLPCPGDKDTQTNADISLAGLILNLIPVSAEKLALPLARALSLGPLARDAAEALGCPGSN